MGHLATGQRVPGTGSPVQPPDDGTRVLVDVVDLGQPPRRAGGAATTFGRCSWSTAAAFLSAVPGLCGRVLLGWGVGSDIEHPRRADPVGAENLSMAWACSFAPVVGVRDDDRQP